MESTPSRIAPLAALLYAGIACIPIGQAIGQVSPIPMLPPQGGTQALATLAPPPADFALKVHINPQARKAQTPSLQKAANLLNGMRIGPNGDRIRFFAANISPNSAPVTGWHGFVEGVTPVEDGVIVAVRVQAIQARTMDTLALVERYHVADGHVTYLESFEPIRKTGRMIFGL